MIREANGSAQGGGGLLEVVVALWILSLGVVGLWSLQLSSRHALLEAGQRAGAVSLAEDMLAQVRAGPAVLAHYSGELPSIDTPPDCDVACDPEQVLAWHQFHWQQALHSLGSIVTPAACIVREERLTRVVVNWRGDYRFTGGVPGPQCGSADSEPETGRWLLFTSYIFEG